MPDALDSLGVAESLASLPAAVRATLAAAADASVPPATDVAAVVLAASARSRLTAALVTAAATPHLGVPVVTVLDEPLPVWARRHTLVVALDSAVADRLVTDPALDGVGVLAVGGPAGERPSPVTETVAALAALVAVGLAPGLAQELATVADALAARLESAAAERSAESRLARRIGRTQPLVYGAGTLGAAAAASWKSSVNRNAKAPSFANSVPGLDFDEVCGWAQHGDVTRQVFTLVVLRHGFETDDQSHRLDVTAETCDEIAAGVYPLASAAATPTAALLDLVLAGELVSLALAADAGIDPGPTPVTERYL